MSEQPVVTRLRVLLRACALERGQCCDQVVVGMLQGETGNGRCIQYCHMGTWQAFEQRQTQGCEEEEMQTREKLWWKRELVHSRDGIIMEVGNLQDREKIRCFSWAYAVTKVLEGFGVFTVISCGQLSGFCCPLQQPAQNSPVYRHGQLSAMGSLSWLLVTSVKLGFSRECRRAQQQH